MKKKKEEKEVPFNANAEPEKVHDLIPEAYRTQSNDPDNYPGVRTAFYAQRDGPIESGRYGRLENPEIVQKPSLRLDPPLAVTGTANPGQANNQIGQVVWNVANEGGDGLPNPRGSTAA